MTRFVTRRQALQSSFVLGGTMVASGLLAACGTTAAAPPTTGGNTTQPSTFSATVSSTSRTSSSAPSAGNATSLGATSSASTLAASSSVSATQATTAASSTAVSSPAATTAAAPKVVTAPGELRFMVSVQAAPESAATYQKILDNFQKEHPSVKINLEAIGGAYPYDKILTELSSDSGPDLLDNWFGPIQNYGYRGLLTKLTAFKARDAALFDDVFPVALELFTVKSDLYAVAYDVSSVALYYNKNAFDRLGMSVPNNTWTLDTYKEAATKLTNAAQQQWGTVVYPGDEPGWLNFLYAFGGRAFNEAGTTCTLDSPAAIESFRYYFVDLKRSSPTPEEQAKQNFLDRFAAGQIGMLPLGSWSYAWASQKVKADWLVTRFPYGKQAGSTGGGRGLCIPRATKRVDDAWAFATYFGLNPQATPLLINASRIPAIKSAAASPAFTKPEERMGAKKWFVEALGESTPNPNPPQLDQTVYAKTWATVQADIFAGKVSPEDGAKSITQQINAYIATVK